MPKTSPHPHLYRKYQTWMFRFKWPKDVIEGVNGQKEFHKSLQTSVLQEAMDKRDILYVHCKKLVKKIRTENKGDKRMTKKKEAHKKAVWSSMCTHQKGSITEQIAVIGLQLYGFYVFHSVTPASLFDLIATYTYEDKKGNMQTHTSHIDVKLETTRSSEDVLVKKLRPSAGLSKKTENAGYIVCLIYFKKDNTLLFKTKENNYVTINDYIEIIKKLDNVPNEDISRIRFYRKTIRNQEKQIEELIKQQKENESLKIIAQTVVETMPLLDKITEINKLTQRKLKFNDAHNKTI